MFLKQVHGIARHVNETILASGGKPDQVQPVLQIRVVQDGGVLLLPTRALRLTVATSVENSGAEHSDVAVVCQIREGDVQGLRATHRQASNRPMRTVGMNAIVFFDHRANVLGKLVFKRTAARIGYTRARDMSVGHHDNHGRGLFRRQSGYRGYNWPGPPSATSHHCPSPRAKDIRRDRCSGWLGSRAAYRHARDGIGPGLWNNNAPRPRLRVARSRYPGT